MNGVIKMGGNGLAAAGIAGQEHIATHIALLAANMELHTDVLHKNHPFVGIDKNSIAQSDLFSKS